LGFGMGTFEYFLRNQAKTGKKYFDAFFAFSGGPCTKNQIFSPNEELEGSKFGNCNNFV
jgi:hypothetical protein